MNRWSLLMWPTGCAHLCLLWQFRFSRTIGWGLPYCLGPRHPACCTSQTITSSRCLSSRAPMPWPPSHQHQPNPAARLRSLHSIPLGKTWARWFYWTHRRGRMVWVSIVDTHHTAVCSAKDSQFQDLEQARDWGPPSHIYRVGMETTGWDSQDLEGL